MQRLHAFRNLIDRDSACSAQARQSINGVDIRVKLGKGAFDSPRGAFDTRKFRLEISGSVPPSTAAEYPLSHCYH